jgi:hypothetical protein
MSREHSNDGLSEMASPANESRPFRNNNEPSKFRKKSSPGKVQIKSPLPEPPTYTASMLVSDKITQLHEYWDKTRYIAGENFASERADERKRLKEEITRRLQLIVELK